MTKKRASELVGEMLAYEKRMNEIWAELYAAENIQCVTIAAAYAENATNCIFQARNWLHSGPLIRDEPFVHRFELKETAEKPDNA